MVTVEAVAPTSSDPSEWEVALATLRKLLAAEDGCASSTALRKELERKGIQNAKELLVKLRFFDFDADPDPTMPRPDFRFVHRGRSFYSQEAFREVEQKKEQQAETASAAAVAEAPEPDEEEEPTPRRANRQEEARLVTYVVDALESLYDTDHLPETATHVFDSHNERPGSEFENVDAIALHWRSSGSVEITTVEVKLAFNARLVQQANNYRRFSDRVWIAVPCNSSCQEAALELRETDPMLFEYVTEIGLGILACHRGRGRSYDVLPIQWPRRCRVDPVEREEFLERYRNTFEDAKVLAPRHRASYPKLR